MSDSIRHEVADHLRDELKEIKNAFHSKEEDLRELVTAKASLMTKTEELESDISSRDAEIARLKEDILR